MAAVLIVRGIFRTFSLALALAFYDTEWLFEVSLRNCLLSGCIIAVWLPSQDFAQLDLIDLISQPLFFVADAVRLLSEQSACCLFCEKKWSCLQLSHYTVRVCCTRVAKWLTPDVTDFLRCCHGMSVMQCKWQQISFPKEIFSYIQKIKLEFIVQNITGVFY